FLQTHPGAFSLAVPELFSENSNAQPDWPGFQHAGHFDRLRLQAVVRLFLGDLIPNQQVFWQPDAVTEAQELLQWGANHVGGNNALAHHAFVMGHHPRDIFASDFTETELRGLAEEVGKKL